MTDGQPNNPLTPGVPGEQSQPGLPATPQPGAVPAGWPVPGAAPDAPPAPPMYPYAYPPAYPGAPSPYGAVPGVPGAVPGQEQPPAPPMYPYVPQTIPLPAPGYPSGYYAPPGAPAAPQPAAQKPGRTRTIAIISSVVAALAIIVAVVALLKPQLLSQIVPGLGPTPTPVPSVNGTWIATDVYNEQDILTLTQSGSNITGSTPDPATITGTITGNSVNLTEHFTTGPGCYVYYTLTLSSNQHSMYGTANDPCGSTTSFPITFTRQ